MTHREIALEFVSRFCAGDVGGLEPLLAADLRFRGPLHEFRSRDAYLDTLRQDPPEQCGYRLLSLTESPDAVSLFYEYEKADSSVTIAQLCRFGKGTISEILLVFDGRGLE
jgi:hypothetical protein